jgi:quinol monooxygenase YgiN
MIHVTGTLTCTTTADAEIVHRYLTDHIALSRAEPGCLTFNVDPTKDPLVWQLDETFVDEPAFAAPQARTKASAWFAATAHLARDFKITEAGDTAPEYPTPSQE